MTAGRDGLKFSRPVCLLRTGRQRVPLAGRRL